MLGVSKFMRASVGAKIAMAITGTVLLAYVVGHMAGNLQVFLGREALNSYAELLHARMWLLWIVRLVMLVTVIVHVWVASRLTLTNRSVRPVPYAVQTPVKASWPSRNMYVSGAMIAFFVIYHLLQFTLRYIDPSYQTFTDAAGRFDVYTMVVTGFSNLWISASYIIAVVLLGLHLWHGASSVFQSLGIACPRYRRVFNSIGPVLALIIVAGDVAIPLAVLTGLVHL